MAEGMLAKERLGGDKGDHTRFTVVVCVCRRYTKRNLDINEKCCTKAKAARTNKIVRGSDVKRGKEIANSIDDPMRQIMQFRG